MAKSEKKTSFFCLLAGRLDLLCSFSCAKAMEDNQRHISISITAWLGIRFYQGVIGQYVDLAGSHSSLVFRLQTAVLLQFPYLVDSINITKQDVAMKKNQQLKLSCAVP